MFHNRNYICVLDIGSSKVAACVASIQRKAITGIWFEQSPSRGIRDGAIVDPAELVTCLSGVMNNLRRRSGIPVHTVYTTVPANEVVIRHSHAIIPLAERGNKVITIQDVRCAEEQARILGASLDEEIMHAVPVSFTVDGKSAVSNPIGLYGHKLQIDLLLVCGRTATIQNLDRVIHQSGYEIADIFFSGVSTSRAVFSMPMREGITVLCDIGSDTTELMLFNEGVLRDVDVLSLGGRHLTEALRSSLKVPFELAEDIKKSYGLVGGAEQIDEDKEILVKKSSLYRPIKQRLVAEVVHEQARSMCLLIKDSLEKKIPCYEVKHFVAVGRTALVEGFIEMLEQTLAVPVRLGVVENPHLRNAARDQVIPSGQNRVPYLSALGILCEALYGTDDISRKSAGLPVNIFSSAFQTIKSVYKDYF
ncbi:MAG: cell division protein FtsA [Candidatus Omnitrophica bacterium]|nr:cell division protein FtsA [Candidatus Omnitrophota bacterium]